MGYTHYWRRNPDIDPAAWAQAISDCEKIIEATAKRFELDVSSDGNQIWFNGNAARVLVLCDDAELNEIEDDARHYSDAAVARDLGREYSGLVASAKATVRAIQAHRSNQLT